MSRSRIAQLLVAVAFTLVGIVSGTVATASAQATGCTQVVEPGDSVQDMLDSLAPGQTGCVKEGTFVADQFVIDTPGITLTSHPGERATLVGRVRINATADGAVVAGLTLDGRNPGNLLGPLIHADGAVLRDNDITNGHTAICVHVDDYDGVAPHGVVIEGNRIHDCGRLPATNHDHGIYVGEATGTVIRDNWIYSNADRGVQLYPDADNSLVTGNVIDGNGQGVLFGGDDDDSSDGNLVEGNLITNSTIRENLESSWAGPMGSGNVARGNCVWGGVRDDGDGGIDPDPSGFRAEGNLIANPLYTDPTAGDFTLRAGSPCAGPSAAPERERTCVNVRQGTSRRDHLAGTSGSDRLKGRSGGDRLKGLGGRDCLKGGAGRDRIQAADGRRDVVRCGPGRDRAVVDRRDRVRGCEHVRGGRTRSRK